jgi:hypothetical protein
VGWFEKLKNYLQEELSTVETFEFVLVNCLRERALKLEKCERLKSLAAAKAPASRGSCEVTKILRGDPE